MVECTGEGTVLTSISYAVNGDATHLGWQPLRIVASVSVLFQTSYHGLYCFLQVYVRG